MSFASDIAKFAQKTGQKLDRAIVSACYQISEAIVMGTPVDTGRARGNWIPTVNNPAGSVLDVTDKAGTMALSKIGAVTLTAPGNIYYLVNNLPYINRLEYGWSKQAPIGMVRVNVENFQAALRKAVQDVN
jgi:hypothetical protein